MRRRLATLVLFTTLVLLLALQPGLPAQAKARPSPPDPLSHAGERGSPAGSSVVFVENVGQLVAGARFRLYGGGPTLWLADDAVWVTVAPSPPSSFVELSAGWNLISLPFSPTVPYRAGDLVESMRQQGITVTHIARWQDGAWRSYVPGFGPDNYSLEFGRGYFVRTNGGGRWRP